MQQLPIATPAGAAVTPGQDGAAAVTEAALRAELAKWRERVPKLAAALRQRTAEVEQLRRGLDGGAALSGNGGGNAGARARDELIAELDSRLQDLKERYKSAQAELHKRQLDVDELRGEAEDWKQKWQTVTRTLDEQSSNAEQHDQRIARLEAERDAACRDLDEAVSQHLERKRLLQEVQAENESLRARNEQLFETTELANRQIEALSGSIAELRQAREQERERASEAAAELDRARQAQQQAEAALAEIRSAADGELTLARRAQAEQLERLEARAAHLEQQLAERSELVVNLEKDVSDSREALQQLSDEREEIEAARLRAERHARENAEHIGQLDAKVERQQQLMVDLEAELADANRALAEQQRAAPAAVGDTTEVAQLQQQVRKLEQMVRERTEALNQLEWRHRLVLEPPDAPDDERADGADCAAAGGRSDGKLMAVLNQQLTDARAHNGELLDRIRALETELAAARSAGDDDPLTLIHGVGQKLAEQLHALGIHTLDQVAELNPADLDHDGHVLHPHRARILRDRWIEQAAKLTQT
jgi:predicted flap endonuclease-1-like 5' DNA nuclease